MEHRGDTLKVLWTLSSIPLIARLFPGKTASELYHNDLANDLRLSLLSIKHQQSGLTKSAGRASLLNKLLEELTKYMQWRTMRKKEWRQE